MIDKKVINPEALDLLWRIMQTCPATPLNGGEHAKKHLQDLCEKGENVLGCELRKGIRNEFLCGCEGKMDVYSHLLANTKSDLIGKLEIMEYFGGDIHAKKILEDAKKDGLPRKYSLKVIYGHLLVPVVLGQIEDGAAIDNNGILIEHLLIVDGQDDVHAGGDVVLMHYGFIVGKISAAEMDILNVINQKSPLYLEAIAHLKLKMDFATMHYYPRSRKMAGK